MESCYLTNGTAPNEEVKTLFEKIKEFMKKIYRTMTGWTELSPKVEEFYKSLLSGDLVDQAKKDSQTHEEARSEAQTKKTQNDTAEGKIAQQGKNPVAEESSLTDQIINDPNAPLEAKAEAVLDEAGEVLLQTGQIDPDESPIEYLKANAERLDPKERERVIADIETLAKAYPPEKNQYLAPNGKPSNLNHAEWYAVRTPSFKEWFGDWEALAKQTEFDSLVDEAMNTSKISANEMKGKMLLREATKEEIAEVLRQGGPDITGLEHEITSKEIHHALKGHGQETESVEQPGQRPLIKDDISLIPAVIDAPTQIKVQPHGKNRTSVIYSRDFGNGSIYYVERVFETSKRNEPRLTMKTAWVMDANTGVKPSTTAVYTPLRNSNILFSEGRVNPDSVSKITDENGEPKPVYNGGEKFDTFDPEKAAQEGTFWFTTNKKYAQEFTDNIKNGETKKVFLNIRNPANWDMYDKHGLQELRNMGYDGVELKESAETTFIAFEPTQIKSTTDNAGTYNPQNPSILFQTAYHGSPHRFDRFDSSHMGTGEGAQAYGWGHYLFLKCLFLQFNIGTLGGREIGTSLFEQVFFYGVYAGRPQYISYPCYVGITG